MPHKNMFKCKICKKEFNNVSALGGHTGSHNRYKGMILNKRGIKYSCLNCDEDITSHARTNRKRLYCNSKCMSDFRLKEKMIFGVSALYIEDYRSKHKVCEICGLDERAIHSKSNGAPSKLSLDHDHKTGRFRGVLCSSCNRNLGWAENRLSFIIKYISK